MAQELCQQFDKWTNVMKIPLGSKKSFQIPTLYLTIINLITRYMNNSNGNDKARHTLFMKETPKIKIVELGTLMRLGKSIYSLKDQIYMRNACP